MEHTACIFFWFVLFVVQVSASYFSYFLTGWDAGMVFEYSHWIGVFGYKTVNDLYYSMYPNNVLMTMLFAWIMRLFAWIVGGEPGIERCAFAVIVVQCLLSSITGALCQDMVRRITRSRRLSWIVAIIYAGFVALSPWRMIPYSDSMALIVPTMILWLYCRSGEKNKLTWFGIGLLTGIGYLLKPQTVIATIVLIIAEAMNRLAQNEKKQLAAKLGALTLAVALIIGPGFQAIVHVSGFSLDPEKKTGMLHFVMMGLNDESNGVFSSEDEKISVTAKTKAERTSVQMREIKNRIERFGLFGLLEHLKKKTLTNYADGTFAWACEGQFFNRMLEDKDSLISPTLKRIIYPDENGEIVGFTTIFQCIWLGLLLGALFCAAAWRSMLAEEQLSNWLMVMMLCVIGLTLFEWIFEARARYLYIYAPFYVMLGTVGIWYTLEHLRKKAK